jgi:hypothetical protein
MTVSAGWSEVRPQREIAGSGVAGGEPALDVVRDIEEGAGVEDGRDAAGEIGAQMLMVQLSRGRVGVVAIRAARRGDEMDV